MSSPLFCIRSSNEKLEADFTAELSSRSANADLLKQFIQCFFKESWPVVLTLGYAKDGVKDMCKIYELLQAKIINAFRDFIDNIGRREPADMKPLINGMHMISCSTAECRRGFSLMNIIVSNTRSNLTIPHVSSLMFIKLHGPQQCRHGSATTDLQLTQRYDCSAQQYFDWGWLKCALEICLTCNQCCVALLGTAWQSSIVIYEFYV